MRDPDRVELQPLEQGPLAVTLQLTAEEVELALATDGISLRHSVMMALIAAMVTTESDETSNAFARALPWLTPPEQ